MLMVYDNALRMLSDVRNYYVFNGTLMYESIAIAYCHVTYQLHPYLEAREREPFP